MDEQCHYLGFLGVDVIWDWNVTDQDDGRMFNSQTVLCRGQELKGTHENVPLPTTAPVSSELSIPDYEEDGFPKVVMSRHLPI